MTKEEIIKALQETIKEVEVKMASVLHRKNMVSHERWQQKKRFILRMWKRGYKGMPKVGWIKWNWRGDYKM